SRSGCIVQLSERNRRVPPYFIPRIVKSYLQVVDGARIVQRAQYQCCRFADCWFFVLQLRQNSRNGGIISNHTKRQQGVKLILYLRVAPVFGAGAVAECPCSLRAKVQLLVGFRSRLRFLRIPESCYEGGNGLPSSQSSQGQRKKSPYSRIVIARIHI